MAMVLVEESPFPGVSKRWVVKKKPPGVVVVGIGADRAGRFEGRMVDDGLMGSVFCRLGVDWKGRRLLGSRF